MKFQLITTAAAIFTATVVALPAPQTDDHGLLIDTDDWIEGDGADGIETRNVNPVKVRITRDFHGLESDTDDWVDGAGIEARARHINEAAVNFNFTSDFDFALDRLLARDFRHPGRDPAPGRRGPTPMARGARPSPGRPNHQA